ncbi:MAG: ABC transporter ATP-binding protein [Firmicutes bacterium]|nr:ABC transporter ATP-binding protein [Bacillota bacterium]
MNETVLELKHVTYRYPGAKDPALEDMSLAMSSREKIAILGKNGTGKSTMFLILNGVIRPEKGQVLLDRQVIRDKKSALMHLRKNIGLVFQDPDDQFIAPRVFEEISFGALNAGKTQEEARELVEEIIEVLEIDHLKEKSLYSLSGGEKKLVSIAGVLALEPKIILFDEPTAGLDHVNAERFKEVIDRLYRDRIGLVISTHDVDFAWEWSERTLIIKDGKVFADGPSEEIMTDRELMEAAELKRPYLVEFTERIRKGREDATTYPRSFDELEKLLETVL